MNRNRRSLPFYFDPTMKKALGVIFSVLILDQIIKIWIKTTYQMDEAHWIIPGIFRLFFIENNGMAFGMELGGSSGKLFLSLFRVAAVLVIGYYLWGLVKKNANTLLIVCISLIFAGAIGNIIDSVIYGKMFSASCGNPWLINRPCDPVARMFPAEGGYGTWFHGMVVDMFQFTVRWPKWVPNVGGKLIFGAIFNLADAAISVGVIMLIIFNKKVFGKKKEEEHSEKKSGSIEAA